MTPYGLATARLVVRVYEPRDAPALQEVVAAEREHLLPWLTWAAAEPQTIDEKLELIRRFRGQVDLGADLTLGIFDAEGGALLGGTGLHPRIGPGAREIGYWIRAGAQGRGYVSEAVRGLVRLGFEHLGLRKLEIRVNPANERSSHVPRALGFHLDGVLRSLLPGVRPSDPWADAEVWSLLEGEFRERSAAFPEIRAWDALERPLRGGRPAPPAR